MIVPDVNLLVYAYDETAPHHRAARAWWEKTLSGREAVGVPWIVVLAFCRLTTHPAICANPMTVRQARQAVEQWWTVPHVRFLAPTPATIQRFFDLLEAVGAGGNLCTDAMIAAQAIEQGGEVHSNDVDFGRFPGLVWTNPLRKKP